MRRGVLLALALLAVLAGGLVLARFLVLENRERAAIRTALEHQAAGEIELLRLDSATAYSLGDVRGPTRVAWRPAGTDATRVQCADVERRGSVLSGREVILRGLSRPIALDAGC